jgi:hypothetical protein
VFGRDPISKRRITRCSAPPIGQNPPRNTQQPRQRIIRNIVQPSPRDDEHIGKDILGRPNIRPPTHVGPDSTSMRQIERFESRASVHYELSVRHAPNMTANHANARFRPDTTAIIPARTPAAASRPIYPEPPG